MDPKTRSLLLAALHPISVITYGPYLVLLMFVALVRSWWQPRQTSLRSQTAAAEGESKCNCDNADALSVDGGAAARKWASQSAAIQAGSATVFSVERDLAPGSPAFQLLQPLVQAHGHHALAHSMLYNPEFNHFYVPGKGAVVFCEVHDYYRHAVAVTGEPLADPAHWQHLTDLFLQRYPHASFCHVSMDYARLLSANGYLVNEQGRETVIQVQEWKYTHKTQKVRQAAAKARSAGVVVQELRDQDLNPELRQQLQQVSGTWLKQKRIADRTLKIYARNVDCDNMALGDGVRLFVAVEGGVPLPPPAGTEGQQPKRKGSRQRKHKAGGTRQPQQLEQQQQCCLPPPKISSVDTAVLPSADGGQCDEYRAASPKTPPATPAPAPAGWAGSPHPSSLSRVPSSVDLVVVDAEGSESPKLLLHKDHTLTQQQVQQVQLTGREVEMTGHPTAATSSEPAAAGDVLRGGRVTGFLLLDPVWDAGRVTGYVTALVRTGPDAHRGAIQLLYEEALAALKAEGKATLNFGVSPCWNIQDNQFPGAWWLHGTNTLLYHNCNMVYPFRNLAFSKTRYGGGVTADGTRFKDPAVLMPAVYMAVHTSFPGMAMLDQFIMMKFVGFWDGVLDLFLRVIYLR